jgi:hypothetical protein
MKETKELSMKEEKNLFFKAWKEDPFPQKTMDYRRNFLVAGFCLLVLLFNPDSKIISLFIIKFDNPIEPSSVAKILLFVAAYEFIMFLIGVFNNYRIWKSEVVNSEFDFIKDSLSLSEKSLQTTNVFIESLDSPRNKHFNKDDVLILNESIKSLSAFIDEFSRKNDMGEIQQHHDIKNLEKQISSNYNYLVDFHMYIEELNSTIADIKNEFPRFHESMRVFSENQNKINNSIGKIKIWIYIQIFIFDIGIPSILFLFILWQLKQQELSFWSLSFL